LLTAFINFVLVAAVVYFLVVLPYNKLRSKDAAEAPADKQTRLLTEIRDALGGKDSLGGGPRAKDFTIKE
jgi:large conductance mechanosensitive channel